MRLVISLTRSQSEEDPLFRKVIAVGLSWIGDSGIVHFLAKPEDYESEKDLWLSVSHGLSKTDVVPYGWNMHKDIWPCVCLNMARCGIQFPKFQPLTEKWQKTMLGDISYIATQGAYIEAPDAVRVYEFMFGEHVDALDEAKRAAIVDKDEFDRMSRVEHECYHRMLENYK